MEKLLTPEAARNVFKNGMSHDFFKKGGANYVSIGSMDFADSHAQALTNGAAANGATLLAAGRECDRIANGEEMMKEANRELLAGNRIAGAEMTRVSPELAERMLENAERQIDNNKMAEKMAINNQAATR